jgi:hypothetical protein
MRNKQRNTLRTKAQTHFRKKRRLRNTTDKSILGGAQGRQFPAVAPYKISARKIGEVEKGPSRAPGRFRMGQKPTHGSSPRASSRSGAASGKRKKFEKWRRQMKNPKKQKKRVLFWRFFSRAQRRTSIWAARCKKERPRRPWGPLGPNLGGPWGQKALLSLRFKGNLGILQRTLRRKGPGFKK